MRAFARSIVDAVRHPLLVLDSELRVLAANVPFYRIFAGSPTNTEGRKFLEIDGGRWDQPRLRALLEAIILNHDSLADFEFEYDALGAGQRNLLLNAQTIEREEDGVSMILLAIEDDTARRQILTELRRVNAELERRVSDRTAELEKANRGLLESNQELVSVNRELEAFCYSVSHDLRTPLRAVDGFSQELLHEYSDRLDDQGRHYLRRIRIGSQRMGQLIDDLLKLSRVTRAEIRREMVDLTALAETIVAEIRELEPARLVSFTVGPGMAAECDPRLIRIVLENLLGNAWKFTSKKSKAEIVFDRAIFDGRLEFVVRDDGVGFDMAYAANLFGAFQRLHSERDFTGTGIGLATVQRIIRRHSGEIRGEGAIGRGAAFFFTLPGSKDNT